MNQAVKYVAKRSDSVLTPSIRWAYPFVHDKSTKRSNGQPRVKPVWINTGLMPKLHHDPAQCPNYIFLQKLCMEAVIRETAWGGQFPAGGHWPIQDGDAAPKPKAPIPGQPPQVFDPNKPNWRKGHWVFEASTSLDPGPRVCVMQNGQAIEIPARIVNGRQMYKSGDYGIGSIHAYTFFNEKWGVNFGFEGILWTAEGEAIGSSGPRSAAQMFGQVAPTAAAPAAPTHTAPAMPAGGYVAAPPQAPAPQPPQAYAPPTAPVYPPQAPVAPPPPAAPVAPGLPPFPGPR